MIKNQDILELILLFWIFIQPNTFSKHRLLKLHFVNVSDNNYHFNYFLFLFF